MTTQQGQVVAFLDFDGVTCTTRAHVAQDRSDWGDPIAFKLLARLARDTGCRFVVSSARRKDDDLPAMLKRHGLAQHMADDWRTKDFWSRSAEIKDWLSRNGNPLWIIIDDERCDFDADQLARLIHTDMQFGFGLQDYLRAGRLIGALRGQPQAPDADADGPYQTPRITISNMAAAAIDALDQGDDQALRDLLAAIRDHPLSR